MNIYFVIIVSLLLAQFLFKVVIEMANLLNLSETLPTLFANDYPTDKYRRSQKYEKESTLLDLAESTFFMLILFALILTGSFNFIDSYARSFGLGIIPTGLIFFGIIFLAATILRIPFEIYSTFVIEEKYGFNRTTIQIFISDLFKQIIVISIIGSMALAAVIWLFEEFGPHAWLYCWISLVFYQLIICYIAPNWIMPLFNKFSPLPEGTLKEALNAYAKEQNFALQGIYTMDGSKRSTKANAFFTGFGRYRRVILFDTLIENYSVEELVTILAHEIGHYKKRHTIKLIALSIFNTGLMLYLFSWFLNNPQLFKAFGMENISSYASLLFFSFLYMPVQTILLIMHNAISRHFEYEADHYAATTYHKPDMMISALKKLTVDNLSNLTPHPWKVAVSYTHPTVIQRIKVLQQIE
jgi:STE24 endopeptidase